jgi:dynein heavy chain 2
VTFEAPPGIKKNMQRSYEAWPAEYVQAGSAVRAQLLFVLAWFHAIVQARAQHVQPLLRHYASTAACLSALCSC